MKNSIQSLVNEHTNTNKCPAVAYLVLVLSVTLLLGCAGITGEYRVVDLDQTLEGVVSIPKGSKVASLAEYKKIIADRYEDKTLQFTNDEPHAFLVPVDLHGRVGGMIIGGWKRGKSKDSIVIYRWVSGSMYTSWGDACLANRKLAVTLKRYGDDAVTLYLEKIR